MPVVSMIRGIRLLHLIDSAHSENWRQAHCSILWTSLYNSRAFYVHRSGPPLCRASCKVFSKQQPSFACSIWDFVSCMC